MDNDAVERLKAFIAERQYPMNSRLPPERALAGLLGLSRGALRKALATLESEGGVWRHVGRGTFVGSRPAEDGSDLSGLVHRTSPAQVMETRLTIEPQFARVAATNATVADVRELQLCCRRSRMADEWRTYETWDDRIHRAVAQATHNALLLSLFDTLNSVRRAVVWNRARATGKPPRSHHSFAQHEALVAAIASHDPERAAECMRTHLDTVRRRLLESADAA